MAEFQITSAEVLEVLYSDYNPNLIYGLKVKPLDGTPSGDDTNLSVITVKPLNTSILRIPIKGEVVLILKAPSSYASGTKLTTDCYYFDIVSLQSSIHHNALPTVSSRKVQIGQTSGDSDKYNESSSGNTNKQEETKIDENFSENPTVKPLQPYVGDIIIEGRYGNSIRFSTTPKSGNFTVAPKWNGGSNSAPITIFRNSKQGIDTQKINDYITEDFTNNENIIVMTSGQNIEFEQGSGATTSINSKSITSWKDENWGTTPQILISSGRLVFNSNQKEIIAFAKNGIGLSTETSIAIDAKNTVAINSNKIELGNEADEPLILGNVCKMWIESLIDKLSALTVITPTGTSSPLTTSPQWPVIASLKAELPNLLSDLSFTKKSVSTSTNRSAKVLPILDFKMTPEDKQVIQQLVDEVKAEGEALADTETEEQRITREEYISFKESELNSEQFAHAYVEDDFEIDDDELEESALTHFSYITDQQADKQVQTAQGGTGVGSATGFENISTTATLPAVTSGFGVTNAYAVKAATGRNVVIGDSISIGVDGAYTNISGITSPVLLNKSGEPARWLLSQLNLIRTPYNDVKNVVLSIGSNNAWNLTSTDTLLAEQIRRVFPYATKWILNGNYGWGSLKVGRADWPSKINTYINFYRSKGFNVVGSVKPVKVHPAPGDDLFKTFVQQLSAL
jgi:hypothetical protein